MGCQKGGCARRQSSGLYGLWDAGKGAGPDEIAQIGIDYGMPKGGCARRNSSDINGLCGGRRGAAPNEIV